METKLTLAEMAARHKCSAKTFKKYVKEYDLPYVPLGRAKLFNPSEVEARLKSLVITPEPEPEIKSKGKRDVFSSPKQERYEKMLGWS